MRGETPKPKPVLATPLISIHSPHTRGDRAFRLDHSGIPFQSTPLARGETLLFNLFKRLLDISIHSPHTRGDGWSTFWAVDGAHFNPLPSHEGRLVKRFLQFFYNNFNPLPSHEGRQARGQRPSPRPHFNPLPSHEGRRFSTLPGLSGQGNFNPLPSHEGRRFIWWIGR